MVRLMPVVGYSKTLSALRRMFSAMTARPSRPCPFLVSQAA